jgi:hypothetical protein
MVGWTLTDSARTGWGNWSAWSTTPYTATTDREVEPQTVPATYKTVHQYYHYCKAGGYCANYSKAGYTLHIIETDKAPWNGNQNGYTASGSVPYWTFWSCGNKDMWFPGTGYTGFWFNDYPKTVVDRSAYTQWRYRDAIYTYTFEKWDDWTNWQIGTTPQETASKEVETRTMHRFKANDIKLMAYNYKRYKYTNLSTSNTHYAYDSSYPDSMGYPGAWEYDKTYAEKTVIATVDGNVTLYGGYNEASWYVAYVNDRGYIWRYRCG